MRLVYCPYTDQDLPLQETSSEHVIPLALGGANGFEIRAATTANSSLGSTHDGKLANELIFALRRTRLNARGHSGNLPAAKFKRASYGPEARPAQVSLAHGEGIRVWDPKDRELKSGVGTVRIQSVLDVDLPIRFSAKVALAAGYFAYKELFRECVDHSQLRETMNLDLAGFDLGGEEPPTGLEHLTIRVDNYLFESSSDRLRVLREWCTSVNGSKVVLIPGHDCFSVCVGLLGQYLGFVNVPANTEQFPNSDDYHWGHVVSIEEGRIKRQSWMQSLSQWVVHRSSQSTELIHHAV